MNITDFLNIVVKVSERLIKEDYFSLIEEKLYNIETKIRDKRTFNEYINNEKNCLEKYSDIDKYFESSGITKGMISDIVSDELYPYVLITLYMMRLVQDSHCSIKYKNFPKILVKYKYIIDRFMIYTELVGKIDLKIRKVKLDDDIIKAMIQIDWLYRHKYEDKILYILNHKFDNSATNVNDFTVIEEIHHMHENEKKDVFGIGINNSKYVEKMLLDICQYIIIANQISTLVKF